MDPKIDACNIGKRDLCALLEELINCDEPRVEIPEGDAPVVVGIIMDAVDSLCQRQPCDPDELLSQDLIRQIQECLEDDQCLPTPNG